MKKIIVTTLAIVFSLSVFAQNTPTPYQKRQLELSKKYFQIFYGYRMSMADEVFYEQLAEGKDAQEFLLAMGILGYAMNHSEAQVKKVLTQMKNEYAAAEKLKNATDIRLEKEAKARAEQAAKEQKLKEVQEAYEKTDVGTISKNIKSTFEKWNLKGEFEKEADYAGRLLNQSQTAFDEICLEQIKDRIKNKNTYYWEKKLLPYNTENEFFMVYFKINDIEWQSNINIPIVQAEDFKNKFSDLRFNIGDYDWCFVENSLCPSLITLKSRNNDTKYQFPVLLQNQSEISQSFEDIEIDNPYLSGYVFKFSNAKAITERQEREKQRLDSLELATFNNRLDSVYSDYNKQLLANPYNLKESVLKDYDKITLTSTGNRQNLYDRKVSDMKSEFNRLEKAFEYNRSNEYRQNGKLFATEIEFDSFYKNGIDSYQAEIEKRTILKFFSDNVKFIETMDFQKEAKETLGSAFMSGYTGSYTDYSKINADRKKILSAINESQNKPYYSQLLDFVVETNNGLNKEWSKNGQHFESKTMFYNAYISDDYKKILKEKKKKS
ncbi:MAG TPA: hypothetical protein PKL52_01725 [Tenuifilaceae bacterium]|nr:hypothetical protein [Tenuifilaceae bacterium]